MKCNTRETIRTDCESVNTRGHIGTRRGEGLFYGFHPGISWGYLATLSTEEELDLKILLTISSYPQQAAARAYPPKGSTIRNLKDLITLVNLRIRTERLRADSLHNLAVRSAAPSLIDARLLPAVVPACAPDPTKMPIGLKYS
jgi:hypothetical protein